MISLNLKKMLLPALVAFSVVSARAQMTDLEADLANALASTGAQSATNLNNGKPIERVVYYDGVNKLPGSKNGTKILVIEDVYYGPIGNTSSLGIVKKDIWSIDCGQVVSISNSGNGLKIVANTVNSKYVNKDTRATTFHKEFILPDITQAKKYTGQGATINAKMAGLFHGQIRRNLR